MIEDALARARRTGLGAYNDILVGISALVLSARVNPLREEAKVTCWHKRDDARDVGMSTPILTSKWKRDVSVRGSEITSKCKMSFI
jgi:hypothetical protein